MEILLFEFSAFLGWGGLFVLAGYWLFRVVWFRVLFRFVLLFGLVAWVLIGDMF